MTRIVALHGFLGQPEDWKSFGAELKKLAPGVEFQTVDVMGFLQDKNLSMEEWAETFNQEQKNQHVEKNILVGYSMGGRLSLQATLDKPGLWDEVFLISTHPGLQTEDEKARRRMADLDWAEKFTQLPWNEVVRLWNGQPVFIGSHEPARVEPKAGRAAVAHTMVNWSLANQTFAEDGLVSLKPKLHWVVGEKDVKFKDLLQKLKSSGVVENLSTVKGAGHRVLFDKPKELARLVVQQLKL